MTVVFTEREREHANLFFCGLPAGLAKTLIDSRDNSGFVSLLKYFYFLLRLEIYQPFGSVGILSGPYLK